MTNILDGFTTTDMSLDQFKAMFTPNASARYFARSEDIPAGHVLLRRPKSSPNDIRVTIPAAFMREWQADEWKGVEIKRKKIQLLLANEKPGLLALKPVPSDFTGKGVYRLEQNNDVGQARFMTTRAYVMRKLDGDSAAVLFKLDGTTGLLDLTTLSPL